MAKARSRKASAARVRSPATTSMPTISITASSENPDAPRTGRHKCGGAPQRCLCSTRNPRLHFTFPSHTIHGGNTMSMTEMRDADLRGFHTSELEEAGTSRSKLLAAAAVILGVVAIGAYAYTSHSLLPSTNVVHQQVSQPIAMTPSPAPVTTQPDTSAPAPQAAPDVQAPAPEIKAAAPEASVKAKPSATVKAKLTEHSAPVKSTRAPVEMQSTPSVAPSDTTPAPDTSSPATPQATPYTAPPATTPDQTVTPQVASPDNTTTTQQPQTQQQTTPDQSAPQTQSPQ